jgi:DNA-binding CsgD family transcriptional regulator
MVRALHDEAERTGVTRSERGGSSAIVEEKETQAVNDEPDVAAEYGSSGRGVARADVETWRCTLRRGEPCFSAAWRGYTPLTHAELRCCAYGALGRHPPLEWSRRIKHGERAVKIGGAGRWASAKGNLSRKSRAS